LSDSTRRTILLRLVEGEATVGELAAPLPISQPAVSRHLKVLEHAGLIERRVDGQRRPCRLAQGALEGLDSYLGKLREVLDTRYAPLDDLLARMAEDTTPTRPTRTQRKGKNTR
jgi:DNA-binding transcriptional ArsR family regulator